MPRKTPHPFHCNLTRSHASMRPRPDAAENLDDEQKRHDAALLQ